MQTMTTAIVDTRRVAGRRRIQLHSLDELLAEIERVTSAAGKGEVRSLGNWSAAQMFWHLGKFIELSFDGFPFRYRPAPAWVIRLLRFFAWRWLIALTFRPGFKNPAEAAIVEPDPSVTLDSASGYLKQQLARIGSGERMTQQCSIEGPFGHEEWIYIHLRHAELHLSFLALDEK
jgi:hypothetical protein